MTAINIFLIYFFAFFTPTLAFCSMNTQFFTIRQIIRSLCVTSITGACTGLAAAWVVSSFPSVWIALFLSGIAIIFFLLLNERFFTETITSYSVRIGILAAILAVCVILSLLGWEWVITALLSIYGIFSAYDLAHNWERKKQPLFKETKATKKLSDIPQFTYRPNVYLLLLESMHSAEALDKVYGIKNSDCENLLSANDFTIYPSTFSNKHSTPLSLANLLTMSLKLNSEPETLETFARNGYKCRFFDTMFYLSERYAEYVDNSKMPKRVRKLYTLIGPVFAQSRWTRLFMGGIDPFETENDNKSFDVMLSDFGKSLQKKDDDNPTINILHFGANHFGEPWYRVQNAAQVYMARYSQAVEQLRKTLATINRADPDALIVAVGDHGAYHWTGIYEGVDSPEENVRKNGVDPERLAYDFFGVVMGIHWGSIPAPAMGIISHTNLFRWIIAALAGNKKPDKLEDNVSILYGKYILAREGKALEKYECPDSAALSDGYHNIDSNAQLMEIVTRLDRKLIDNAVSSVEEDAALLISNIVKGEISAPQYLTIAKALAKAGKGYEAAQILDDAWQRSPANFDYKLLNFLVQAHISLNNNSRAEEIIRHSLKHANYPHRYALLYLMRILWREGRYGEIMPLIPQMLSTQRIECYETQDNFLLENAVCCMAIEKAEGKEAAEKWLDERMASSIPEMRASLFANKFALRLPDDPKGAMQLLKEGFASSGLGLGFALCYLRLIILSGDLESAKKFHDTIAPSFGNSPTFLLASEEIAGKGSVERIGVIAAKSEMGKILGSTAFDADWYQKTYSPNAIPAIDYVKNGIVLSRNPYPAFDVNFYVRIEPALLEKGIEPLLHYVMSGKRNPQSISDEPFLKNQTHPVLLKKGEI